MCPHQKNENDPVGGPTFNEEEVDEKIMSKFCSLQSYDKNEMVKCVINIAQKFNLDYKEHFCVFDSFEELNENYDNKIPMFFILGNRNNSWVLFCQLLYNDDIKIFYKDPSCTKISPERRKKLESIFPTVQILENDEEDLQFELYDYGPLCLRNLEIFINLMDKNEGILLEDFRSINFCKSKDLEESKKNYVTRTIHELAKKDDFKAAFQKFVDGFPLDLITGTERYLETVRGQLEKNEEDIDFEAIERSKQQILNKENLEEFSKNYSPNAAENVTKRCLVIVEKFPQESRKLKYVMEILEVAENKERFLEILGRKMGLRRDHWIKILKECLKNREDTTDAEVEVDIIAEITNSIPTVDESVIYDEYISSDDLLNEIKITDLQKLKKKFKLVITKRKEWKNSDIITINGWAKQKKGKLTSSDEDVCNTIAAMERVLHLLKGGFYLRNTQILSTLIFFHSEENKGHLFFHSEENKGHLCEIKTGEGKTIIVALLATIRALQGVPVDVITSNDLLAIEGVKENESFFKIFNLTAATNDPNSKSYNTCYAADIVYGTIGNFQFDFLKETFEGFTIRCGRPFGQVILDEVDSMLVDNGGHIAKLSTPFPGMECLRYIYIKIWQELHKAEKELKEEIEEKIKEMKKTYRNETDFIKVYGKYLQELQLTEEAILTNKIKSRNITDVPVIPTHLVEFVENKLDTWIKNAIFAKFSCFEYEQYRIITDESTKEEIVVPVDYINTGVTLRDTVWSNALHQFVQLKHNLRLTAETLTSSFISNIGYIKNYKNENIFGVTGTLGSSAEQNLLSNIYEVTFTKVPPYKKKIFKELPLLVFEDSVWCAELVTEVLKIIGEERAVLVICETQKDVGVIEEEINERGNSARIRKYASEENAQEIEEAVKMGEIILATNIAGRGTDFKTEEELENKGGLHVCVGFLPYNQRVEDQAFGRTSRQGNRGTAQLIIRQSEVDQLQIMDNINEIKLKRDVLENQRLKNIDKRLVKELDFKDKLFNKFSKFFRNWKTENNQREKYYVSQDLKEFWAFWLEKQNFTVDVISKTNPKEEFRKFKQEAKPMIEGTITHNPFYCISLAGHFLDCNEKQKALRELERCMEIDGKNFDLLAGAHLKFFEIYIGGSILEKCKRAFGKLFHINVEETQNKRKAIDHLEKAKDAINREVSYVQEYLLLDNANSKKDIETVLQLENEKGNVFLKHVYSRLYCLKIFEGNIQQLIENISEFSGQADIEGKENFTLKSVEDSEEFQKFITETELNELQSTGVDFLYSLKEIRDVPNYVTRTSIIEVSAGITSLLAGFAFPLFSPAFGFLAESLISEGIVSFVVELLAECESKRKYWKTKIISYVLTGCTFGLSVLLTCVSFLNNAIELCQKLSNFLKNNPRFSKCLQRVIEIIEKVGSYLESKLSSLLTQIEALKNFGRFEYITTVTLGSIRTIGVTLGPRVLHRMVNECTEQIFDKIADHLKNSMKDDWLLIEKLQTNSKDDIAKAFDEFAEEQSFKTSVLKLSFDIVNFLANKSNIQLVSGSQEIFLAMVEVVLFTKNFAFDFQKFLEVGTGEHVDDTEEIINNICEKVMNKIRSVCGELHRNPKKKNFFTKMVAVENADLTIDSLKDVIMPKVLRVISKHMIESFSNAFNQNPEIISKLSTSEIDICEVMDYFLKNENSFQKLLLEILNRLEVNTCSNFHTSDSFFKIITVHCMKMDSFCAEIVVEFGETLELGKGANNREIVVETLSEKITEYHTNLLQEISNHAFEVMDNSDLKFENLRQSFKEITTTMIEDLKFVYFRKKIRVIKDEFKNLLTEMIGNSSTLIQKLLSLDSDVVRTKMSKIARTVEPQFEEFLYKILNFIQNLPSEEIFNLDFKTLLRLFHLDSSLDKIGSTIEKTLPIGSSVAGQNNNDIFFSKMTEVFDTSCQKIFTQVGRYPKSVTLKQKSTLLAVNQISHLFLNEFEEKLKSAFMQSDNVKNKIVAANVEDILKLVTKLLHQTDLKKILMGFSSQFLQILKGIFANPETLLDFKIDIDFAEICEFNIAFVSRIEETLEICECQNDFNEMIEIICSTTTRIIHPILFEILANTADVAHNKEDEIENAALIKRCDNLFEKISKNFENTFSLTLKNNPVLREKLCNTSSEVIFQSARKLIETGDLRLKIKEFRDKIVEHLRNDAKVVEILANSRVEFLDNKSFSENFVEKFTNELSGEMNGDNDVDKVIEEICFKVNFIVNFLLSGVCQDVKNLAGTVSELQNVQKEKQKLQEKEDILRERLKKF